MGNCIGGFRISDEDLEGLFIEHFLVYGKAPSSSDIRRLRLPSIKTIKARTGKSYNEYLLYLGIPTNKRSTPTKSDEEMLADIVALAEELGRTPFASDLTGRAGVCGKGTYNKRFGTWTNALKAVGLKPTWCPVSDEELLSELRRFRIETGRSPSTRDQLAYGWATFQVRFGGWNNALTKAGLPLNENIYGNKTYGKDGLLYDSISESIVADWLYDNGVHYQAHVPYFGKLIADFKVGPYYIEFFGLPKLPEYADRMKLKRSLCLRRGYLLIELFSEDLTNLDVKLGFLKSKGVDYSDVA
ncbi:hypothetical protein MKX34_23975 [Paenibacillus sp. FSL R5-0636]|uniref:homing endonuclease associated repeat-containing protein n=1 Tax=Paenibacillus TaxID=44249 RepID=UPI00096DD942|nr:hypothetical protein [Paenibacillus odorifer]OMC96226.1 hypothetical protein BJP49_11025 [Paenibacillus odorifer]